MRFYVGVRILCCRKKNMKIDKLVFAIDFVSGIDFDFKKMKPEVRLIPAAVFTKYIITKWKKNRAGCERRTWQTHWADVADLDEVAVTEASCSVVNVYRWRKNQLGTLICVRQENPLGKTLQINNTLLNSSTNTTHNVEDTAKVSLSIEDSRWIINSPTNTAPKHFSGESLGTDHQLCHKPIKYQINKYS